MLNKNPVGNCKHVSIKPKISLKAATKFALCQHFDELKLTFSSATSELQFLAATVCATVGNVWQICWQRLMASEARRGGAGRGEANYVLALSALAPESSIRKRERERMEMEMSA